MKTSHYKGYLIESNTESASLIYKDGNLFKCIASDFPKNNGEEKAKKFIDNLKK